jgi:hypothetical protein
MGWPAPLGAIVYDPIGNIPPAEAEARYYAQTEDGAMVA